MKNGKVLKIKIDQNGSLQCVLCKCGGRKPNEQRFAIGLWFGQKFFNWAFVLFIFLHIFIQHLFRAKGILIPHLHKALSLQAILRR
jgi:hypothetical protein